MLAWLIQPLSWQHIKRNLFICQQGPFKMADGDYAMLSSKPLAGYRCMACDRPLQGLDERPGPYIPTNVMPLNRNTPAMVGVVEPGAKVGDLVNQLHQRYQQSTTPSTLNVYCMQVDTS